MANVVLSQVRMFVPCANITFGPGRPTTIHSPVHTIRMPPGVKSNFMIDEICFYIVLTDGIGTFRLRVEMRGLDDTVLKRTEPVLCEFKGGQQLDVMELAATMRQVAIAQPGLYEFRVVANYAALDEGGIALVRILPR